jgi:hypothetical protein
MSKITNDSEIIGVLCAGLRQGRAAAAGRKGSCA